MNFFKRILFQRKKPVVVIVGPTASGKSSLAIELAKKYNGEVISCDSRQIYKGLEIFSGAITHETNDGVKHHLVSFLNPGEIYSAEEFVQDTVPIIDELHNNYKLPIIAGGTGFWAQALMYESPYPAVPPDYQFRETLKDFSTQELFAQLQEKDPRRATQMDPQNRKRLVRALEIIESLGSVPRIRETKRGGYTFIFVYLKPEKELLDERISKNVQTRVKQGLFQEADTITKQLSRTQCEELGLGYKYIYDVQHNNISEEDFVARMVHEEVQYAKRQKTFLNKVFARYKGKKALITSLDMTKRLTRVSKFL